MRFQPDGSDCEATLIFDAPKSPDEYTWIFPTGCFDYCPNSKKTDIGIIGPIPYFDGGYAYNLNGTPISAAGAGIVPPFPITAQQGALNLYLNNGSCDVRTDDLDLSTSEACQKDCDLDFKLKDVKLIQKDPFVIFALYGGIQNNYNFAISVDFNSINGIFTPGSAYIPANGFYDFAAHNTTYTPNNPANTAVTLEYTVTLHDGGKDDLVCSDSFQFHTPPVKRGREYGYAEMNVAPNPVQTTTKVTYEVKNAVRFNGGTMELYSLTGNLLQTKKVKDPIGVETFNLSGLAAGNYIVVFYHQNTRIGQQIIVKQ